MTRSKKIFVGLALLFFAFLIAVIYDMSRETTFPGSRRRSKEPVKTEIEGKRDTARSNLPTKSAIHQP